MSSLTEKYDVKTAYKIIYVSGVHENCTVTYIGFKLDKKILFL